MPLHNMNAFVRYNIIVTEAPPICGAFLLLLLPSNAVQVCLSEVNAELCLALDPA